MQTVLQRKISVLALNFLCAKENKNKQKDLMSEQFSMQIPCHANEHYYGGISNWI
jgi:hypothetical protein